VESASRRQERSLLISFDEAPAQIVRNVESVGIRLAPHVHAGTLLMCSLRSRAASPEAHAAHIRHLLRKHGARNLVVDPISALGLAADNVAQRAATEILDTAKSQSITSLFTSLLGNKAALSEETPIGISTIADTWMHLTYMNQGGERNRALTVVKSRGTGHSNQIRELVLSKAGPTLTDVYAAGGEVLMGTLRWERENLESRKRESAMREGDLRRREAELTLAESKARTQAAHSVQAVHEAALERILAEREAVLGRSTTESRELLRRRGADALRLGRRTRRRSPR
jgi:circadian clock protein KaiC